jgi:NTE family protein
MRGLILAGGGARGAYEAGALRFVAERFGLSFDLVSGTSVGALNGAWIAASGTAGAEEIWRFWTELRFEQVARFSLRSLVSSPSKWFRRSTPLGDGVGILDPSPLYQLIQERVDWAGLHARIDRRELQAFMVSVTDVGSGRCHIFTDGDVRQREAATSMTVRTRMEPRHCLASASIPFVFPAVGIEGRTYVDGALRQNTPISPAIEAGMGRSLVIGVKRLRSEEATNIVQPTPGFLAGKALNALMLDPIEENLRRIEALNGLLTWAEARYPGFQEACAREYKPYKVVRSVFLRPSIDIGAFAAECWRRSGTSLPWSVRTLLGSVAADEDQREADLLSYLYFDRAFTRPLAELGYKDAAAIEPEIAELFR